MFNLRISGIAGIVGFILSLLIGIISGALFFMALIRALIFAAVFFGLAAALYMVINMFLPDLLDDSAAETGLGAQVDISIGDDDETPALPGESDDGLNEFIANPEETGKNMDSLPGNTLDQNDEDRYTQKGGVEGDLSSALPALPQSIPQDEAGFSETSDLVDVLPDLELMSEAFTGSGASGDGEGAVSAVADSSPGSGAGIGSSGSSASGKKGLDEDFNVHEMASAIQTILKRENKG